MYSMKRMEIKKISERIIKLFASSRLMKFVYANSVFKRNGNYSLAQVSSGKIQKKIYDYGNIPKKKVSQLIPTLHGKKIIILGGDHSITTEVLSCFPHIAVVYFDAHPDIVFSEKRY